MLRQPTIPATRFSENNGVPQIPCWQFDTLGSDNTSFLLEPVRARVHYWKSHQQRTAEVITQERFNIGKVSFYLPWEHLPVLRKDPVNEEFHTLARRFTTFLRL